MYNIVARMKGTILANIVLVGTPCSARLEDFAHRTDAGRYLNGAIDVAHDGRGREEGEGGRR